MTTTRQAHHAWEVWSRGDDYDEPGFVAAYKHKNHAEEKIRRLRRSHPHVRYMLKHKRVAAHRQFGSRAHTRAHEKYFRERYAEDPAHLSRAMQNAIDRFHSTGSVYAALDIVKEAERLGMRIPRGDTIHQAEVISRELGRPKHRHATEHIPTRLGLYRRDPAHLSRTKRAKLSAKIRKLRHEGYPQQQAIAIAHRMLGIPRPRAARRRVRRRRP